MAHLIEIDERRIGDYYYLEPTDKCYYLLEYTARGGYQASPTNNLISNFKIRPQSTTTRLHYKSQAISTLAGELRQAFDIPRLATVTLVPVPPSEHRTDPYYDDRLLRLLNALGAGASLDVRELVRQKQTTRKSHASDTNRLKPDELASNYEVDETLCKKPIGSIIIFDDVLTTGAHFRAVMQVLSARFPSIQISGVFVARVIRPPPQFEDLFSKEPS